MILCVRLGYVLPGKKTIPDQISEDKTPYYKALESADAALANGKIDLTAMKDLLSSMLAQQLYQVHHEAQAGDE